MMSPSELLKCMEEQGFLDKFNYLAETEGIEPSYAFKELIYVLTDICTLVDEEFLEEVWK